MALRSSGQGSDDGSLGRVLGVDVSPDELSGDLADLIADPVALLNGVHKVDTTPKSGRAAGQLKPGEKRRDLEVSKLKQIASSGYLLGPCVDVD